MKLNAEFIESPLENFRNLAGDGLGGRDRSDANFRIGPIDLNLTGGIKQEYNDNVSLTSTSTQEDFITTPHLGLSANWAVTKYNSLTLGLGFSYAKYWLHPDLDSKSILIQPSDPTLLGPLSGLKYQIHVGEAVIDIHEKPSILQDPVTVSRLSQVASFRRLDNVVGTGVKWDLNLFMVTGGYDHQNFISLENRSSNQNRTAIQDETNPGSRELEFSDLDHATDSFNASIGYRLTPRVITGVNAAYSITTYDNPKVQNNGSSYTIGTFASWAVSEYLNVSGSIGYQESIFDRGGLIGDSSNFSSVVGAFSADNRLNRWLTHSLHVRRFTPLGIGSNFTDVKEIGYSISAPEIINRVTTTLGFSQVWNADSSSLTKEDSAVFILSTSFKYELSDVGHISLSYQRSEKESSRIIRNYEQNRILIDYSHKF